MTEMVLVDVDGDKGCGVTNATATPLRSGWEASEKSSSQPVTKQKRKDAKTPKRRAKSRKTQAKELREGPTRAEQVQPVPARRCF
jgi:hypothetical protein